MTENRQADDQANLGMAAQACRRLGFEVVGSNPFLVVSVRGKGSVHELKEAMRSFGLRALADEDDQEAGLLTFRLPAQGSNEASLPRGADALRKPRAERIGLAVLLAFSMGVLIHVAGGDGARGAPGSALPWICVLFFLVAAHECARTLRWRVEFAADRLRVWSLWRRFEIEYADIVSVRSEDSVLRSQECVVVEVRSGKRISIGIMGYQFARSVRDEVRRRAGPTG
jgi:hypothetical protein